MEILSITGIFLCGFVSGLSVWALRDVWARHIPWPKSFQHKVDLFDRDGFDGPRRYRFEWKEIDGKVIPYSAKVEREL